MQPPTETLNIEEEYIRSQKRSIHKCILLSSLPIILNWIYSTLALMFILLFVWKQFIFEKTKEYYLWDYFISMHWTKVNRLVFMAPKYCRRFWEYTKTISTRNVKHQLVTYEAAVRQWCLRITTSFVYRFFTIFFQDQFLNKNLYIRVKVTKKNSVKFITKNKTYKI